MTNRTKFQDLTIQNDFIFKKVMRRKRICKQLIEEILQTKIADISYPEAEKTIEPAYDSRGIRLDVTVDDENHTHYNLEMQVKNLKNPDTGNFILPKRTRYYQAMIDMDSLQKNQEYDLLPTTYIIFICVFDFFEQGNYIYTFRKRCLENLDLELPDETTTMFLNTLGKHGNISNNIKSFFDYVNNHIITSDFTQQIDEEITEIKQDKRSEGEYMLWEAMKTDLKREAKHENQIDTAKRMLKMGNFSLSDITNITQLPLATIKEIQLKLQNN